jgi:transcriptional regulator with XRE-family HTH domain
VPLDTQQKGQLQKIAARVKRLRADRSLTQEELAELVGLSPRTIQKIEAGQLNILVTTVLRLRKALRAGWDELLPK